MNDRFPLLRSASPSGLTEAVTTSIKSASGAVLIVSETAVAMSPGLVAAFSSAGSAVGAASGTVVSSIAGLPVVQTLAVKAGVSKGALIVIAGVPIAREVALAAGLVSLAIVGGYAYFLLNEDVGEEEVRAALAMPA